MRLAIPGDSSFVFEWLRKWLPAAIEESEWEKNYLHDENAVRKCVNGIFDRIEQVDSDIIGFV
jgi:hypothetical protein